MRPLPFLALSIVLAGPVASAQTPDTTTASRYLPLAVGNEWHYNGTETSTGGADVSVQTRHVVLSESAGQPGRFVVETTARRTVGAGAPAVTTQQRVWYVDPVTTRVSAVGLPTVECGLNAPWNGFSCDYSVGGGYGRAVVVRPDTLVTSSKVFILSRNSGTISWTYRYAAGLGLWSYFYESIAFGPGGEISFMRVNQGLRYARVSGVEYGERLFPVAGEPPPSAAGPPLSVAPNPASGPTTVLYALAAAGHVRLSVVDVLGREVALLLAGERPAGPHEAALDVGGLAPGLYLVRLEAGGQSASGRLTVSR